MKPLVQHLVAAGKECCENELLPTIEEFMDIMWHEDIEMNEWGISREEYTDALRTAYGILKADKTSA